MLGLGFVEPGGGGWGGTSDLKCQGCANGRKNQYPNNSLGLPAKSNKIPQTKIKPLKKSHAEFS